MRLNALLVVVFPLPATIPNQPFHRRDVFPGEMFSLVLIKEDAAQLDQVLEGRDIVISPILFVLELGLDGPLSTEFVCAHFALFAVFGCCFPDVDVSHSCLMWS